MKILQLIDEPWDSGLTAYALQAAELLQKSGQGVALGVLSGKVPEAMARSRGLKTIKIENAFDLRRALKETKWDVVNAHTGRTHTWSVIAKILGGSSQRHLAIVRTRGDARPLKINPIFKFIYRKTAAVIAASEHVRKQYEEGLGLSEEKARTIYPAVPVDEPAKLSPLTVGIVGRLDLVKGHTVFLEAAAHVVKEIPTAQFLIAGKEAGISLQLLQNQVAELGLEENIQFLGYVPSATDFMRGCGIGVIASIGSEEVSRACLEWMAGGRPVVGTIVGCLPELIEPEETGLLVVPEDSVALSRAILRLMQNPALAQKWGNKARESANHRFSPAQFLNQTLSIYHWAIDQTKK